MIPKEIINNVLQEKRFAVVQVKFLRTTDAYHKLLSDHYLKCNFFERYTA